MFEAVRLSPAFLIRPSGPPSPPGEGTPSASIRNPAQATESARRVGVQGEGGFWERELTTQRLP